MTKADDTCRSRQDPEPFNLRVRLPPTVLFPPAAIFSSVEGGAGHNTYRGALHARQERTSTSPQCSTPPNRRRWDAGYRKRCVPRTTIQSGVVPRKGMPMLAGGRITSAKLGFGMSALRTVCCAIIPACNDRTTIRIHPYIGPVCAKSQSLRKLFIGK